jgi:hypothetical protein
MSSATSRADSRRLAGLPERAVEGRGVLGGVREDAGIGVAHRVQRGSDHPYLPVHHPGRTQQVRAGRSLGQCHLRVPDQRGIVVHGSACIQHTAVAVIGELVQAQVGHQHGGVADLGLEVGQGEIQDAIFL